METQTTTDPASPSVSAPKTSLAANARRNNEKALNILLSAIPDRHLLSFHDAIHAYNHDDEDLLKLMKDAMEENCIRWQSAGLLSYQEKRANGRQKRKTVAIERFKLKALVATVKTMKILIGPRFDAETTTFAMLALLNNKDEDYTSVSSLMAYKLREEKQKELDQALKERDDFKVKLEKWTNASVLQNEVLNKQRYVSDKSCIGFGIESSSSMESDISSGDETLLILCTKISKEKRPTKQYLHPQDIGSYSLKPIEQSRRDLKDFLLLTVVCSGSMTRRKENCLDFQAFKLDYVVELKINILSVSQSVIKKHNVLFKDNVCFISLHSKFKFVDVILPAKVLESTTVGNKKKFREMYSLSIFLRRIRRIKGKVTDWMFGACPSINPSISAYASRGTYCLPKKFHCPLKIQALPMTVLMNLICIKYLCQAHNDDQRIAFEEEKSAWEYNNTVLNVDIPKDGVFSTNSFDAENIDNEDEGVIDYINMDPIIDVCSTPTQRIHKYHPQSQIIGKRLITKISKHVCLLVSYLKRKPESILKHFERMKGGLKRCKRTTSIQATEYGFLCRLTRKVKRVIGTKWVFRKQGGLKDGTIIKNNSTDWFAQSGYRQEEGCALCEAVCTVARNCGYRLFLAFASFMGFTVYQMDVKSAFLYGNITEEVYVKQPPGFEDPAHPNKVYRVVKALYGLHQAPRACVPDFKSHQRFLTYNDVKRYLEYVAAASLLCSGYLTGMLTINYSLLVDPDLIGPCFNNYDYGLLYTVSSGSSLFLNKQLEGVDRPQDFMPSVTQPSKIFTFMRKHSPKFSCRITPLTPSRLEVVTALAAEEEHSTKSSFLGLRVLQGMIKPVVKHHAFWVESQNLKKQKRRRKKQRKNVSSVKLGRNKVEGTLSEEHYVQEEDTADPFFDDIVDKDAAVASDIDRKSNEQKSSSTLLSNSSYGSGSKNKLKLLKFLLLFLDQEMRRVARKIQAEWDAEEERKRLLQRFYSNGLREWKGCGCNDKKEMKRVFQGKEKITISEEQPFKKLKLRTETVDEIRNYLRVVDFEKCAQERESLEGISMITELQVIDSPDGEYLIIHRGNNQFRAFDTLWEILHILDRTDCFQIYRVAQVIMEHIPQLV
ncbi:putative ribonuclease H-like domain-containing protein [Tanacetum coccineum]